MSTHERTAPDPSAAHLPISVAVYIAAPDPTTRRHHDDELGDARMKQRMVHRVPVAPESPRTPTRDDSGGTSGLGGRTHRDREGRRLCGPSPSLPSGVGMPDAAGPWSESRSVWPVSGCAAWTASRGAEVVGPGAVTTHGPLPNPGAASWLRRRSGKPGCSSRRWGAGERLAVPENTESRPGRLDGARREPGEVTAPGRLSLFSWNATILAPHP